MKMGMWFGLRAKRLARWFWLRWVLWKENIARLRSNNHMGMLVFYPFRLSVLIFLDFLKRIIIVFFQVLGWKGNPTAFSPDFYSNTRRVFCHTCLILVFLSLFYPSVSDFNSEKNAALGRTFLVLGIALFITNVVAIPFQETGRIFLIPKNWLKKISVNFDEDKPFTVNAQRLLWDTIVSAVFLIVAFAFVFKGCGLIHDRNTIEDPSLKDAIYFSTVTFSTLGYGDFAPPENARLYASLEALLGNLHLGMFVGATFSALRRRG